MKEIACASAVGLLMDYLEGVLPPDPCAALEAHLAGCPRCVAFLASYRDTVRILREATATTLTADLQHALRAFLRARCRVPPAEP